jgi:hypothetical protein
VGCAASWPYVVPRAGCAPTVAALREHLDARPARLHGARRIRALPELPLTSNGKLDRARLPEPDGAGLELGSALGGPPHGYGACPGRGVAGGAGAKSASVSEDNYFDLGGDSILSLRVRARALERGLSFSLPDLFRNPPWALLAEVVDGRGGERVAEAPGWPRRRFALVTPETAAALPETVEDAYPLSRMQAGMLFHMQYASVSRRLPRASCTNALLRARSRRPAFQRAVDHLLARSPRPAHLFRADPLRRAAAARPPHGRAPRRRARPPWLATRGSTSGCSRRPKSARTAPLRLGASVAPGHGGLSAGGRQRPPHDGLPPRHPGRLERRQPR